MGRLRANVLYAVVILSGGAGLMYQVAWTRRVVTVTSATATSQALVLAVFMAGLGGGAVLGGRWAGGIGRPVLGYALAELAAAALALGAMPVTALSEAVRARAGLAPQLLFIAVYFLLITTLMGMALPFLIEASLGAEKSPQKRARVVSGLYGLNTAGAAMGCLFAGFVTIERVGLTATAEVGAALATAAALIALVARREQGKALAPARALAAPMKGGVESGVERRWLVAAGVSGAVGLGAEVVWTRLCGLIVPNTVYALTQVLFAVLVGIAGGAFLAGLVARRAKKSKTPHRLAVRAAGRLASAGALLLGLVPFVVIVLAGSQEAEKALAAGHATPPMLALLAMLSIASACIASVLPLLVMGSRAAKGSSAFASLSAANTLGSVAGSALAGFVLLPWVGSRVTVFVMQLTLLGLALLLLDARRRRLVPLVFAVCLVLFYFNEMPRRLYAARIGPTTKILEFREGIESNVMVTEDANGTRQLWIGSIWVAGTAGPHAAFGHIPGLFVEQPKRVLGIALGTGQTFAAVFKHGVEHFDCVEIDAGVVDLSKKWFRESNGGLLDDPRVVTHVEDGRAFMRSAQDQYDVIVLEPLQSWTAGTTNLYTREFYEDARRILARGGVLAQWIPFYGQEAPETRAMVRTGLDVFPYGYLWLIARDGIVVYAKDPPSLTLDTLDRRIAERDIGPDLMHFPARSAADLLSYLLLGPEGLKAWSDGAEVIVDDRPFLEFRAARAIGRGSKLLPILATIRPYLDDLGAYVAGADVASADAVRRAAFELQFIPPDDHAQRIHVLEALGPQAATSAHWRSLYERELQQR